MTYDRCIYVLLFVTCTLRLDPKELSLQHMLFIFEPTEEKCCRYPDPHTQSPNIA